MNFIDPPISRFYHPLLDAKQITVHIKHDELIHPIVSGNKLYKLKRNIAYAQDHNLSTVISFGGAYSNHLHALAFLGRELKLNTVGIIRGELIYPLNPTLQDCVDWGMELVPVSRTDYRLKVQSVAIEALIASYENVLVIPEGGNNKLGRLGAAEMLSSVDQSQYDFCIVPCGTGTTCTGLIKQAQSHLHVIGVAALKGASWLQDDIAFGLKSIGSDNKNWSLELDAHFSGFGKVKPELVAFIQKMQREYNLELDPVYNGKAFWALIKRIESGLIPKGSRVLYIHTGGLQGVRGGLLS